MKRVLKMIGRSADTDGVLIKQHNGHRLGVLISIGMSYQEELLLSCQRRT